MIAVENPACRHDLLAGTPPSGGAAMKRLAGMVYFFLAAATIVVVPAVLVVLTIERGADVAAGKPRRGDMAAAQGLLDKYGLDILGSRSSFTLSVDQRQLNSLVALATAGIDRVRARAVITPSALALVVTVVVPRTPLGGFVNIGALIAPSPSGLRVARLTVGRLRVPTMLVKPALRLALSRALGEAKGEAMVEAVRSLGIDRGTLTVGLALSPPLLAMVGGGAALANDGERVERVRLYYERLLRLSAAPGRSDGMSAARFMEPLFRMAKRRSRDSHPVRENAAAILALAIHLGDGKIERLIGRVRTGALAARKSSIATATLAGRDDWARHFMVSAGLALTAGGVVADAAGELKERRDFSSGNGFSFADLAADRAGVRFAEMAVASAAAARLMQDLFAATGGEGLFFPAMRGLPDSLTPAQFRSRYGTIGSAEYRAVVADIERRIDALPIHRRVDRIM